MVDPVGFFGRKLANAAVGAVTSRIGKAYRERRNAPNVGQARFDELMTLEGHQAGPGRYQGKAVYGIAALPHGDALVTGGADGSTRMWPLDGSAGRILTHLPLGQSVRTVAVAPDGRLAIGGDDRQITITQPITAADQEARVAVVFPYRQQIDRLVWSPDGVRIAAFSREAHLLICAPADGGLTVAAKTWLGESVGARGIRFTPDGRAVARSSYGGVVSVFFDGSPAPGVKVPRTELAAFDFAPDGGSVAVGTADGTIRILEWIQGAMRHVLRLHEPAVFGAHVSAVKYNPSGTLLATGGYDGVIKLWRPHDGALLGTEAGMLGSISDLAWSGDGRLAASGDRGARVWSVTW